MLKGKSLFAADEGTELTCPVRIKTEYKAPGAKEPHISVSGCEAAVVIMEKVTGAERSEDDPTEFVTHREYAMESMGFRDVGGMLRVVEAACVGFLRRISGEDDRRYRQNVLHYVAAFLDMSGISRDDIKLQISQKMFDEQKAVEKEAKEAAAERGTA